jgi:hypothetical protein
MMDKKRRKRALGLISFLILVPLLTLFWDVTLGSYLLLGGLLLSSIISATLARDARKEIFKDPTTCNSPDRAGDIIWVSLDDEHGNPLPAADAQRKLDEARAKAGPMDMVRVKPTKK